MEVFRQFWLKPLYQSTHSTHVHYCRQLTIIEVLLVGGAEIYRNTEQNIERRQYPGGVFDPLGLASGSDERAFNLKTAELKHGRLAMIAFLGARPAALSGCLLCQTSSALLHATAGYSKDMCSVIAFLGALFCTADRLPPVPDTSSAVLHTTAGYYKDMCSRFMPLWRRLRRAGVCAG
jgi:Chlorophyll A-B binding protein